MNSIGPFVPGVSSELENGVYCGDSKELVARIPDRTISLIFTDPVYDRIADFKWLAEQANRVLKPGGHLLTFYGLGFAEDTFRALREGGRKVSWPLVVHQPGQTQRVNTKMFSTYYGCLWCGGGSMPYAGVADVQTSYPQQIKGGKSGPKEWRWRKNPFAIAKLIAAFSAPGDLVLDPFAGFCSVAEACIMTGRRYLAFELDQEKVEWSREQLAEVQPAMIAPDGDDGFKQMTVFDVADEEGSGVEDAEPTAEAL